MEKNKDINRKLPKTVSEIEEGIMTGYDRLLSMVKFPTNSLFESIKGTEGNGVYKRHVNFHVYKPIEHSGKNVAMFSVFSRGLSSGLSASEILVDNVEYQVRRNLGKIAILVPHKKPNGKIDWVWYSEKNHDRAIIVSNILNNFTPLDRHK